MIIVNVTDINLSELPLYKQLHILRYIQGMSQSELADKLQLHRSAMSRIENGDLNIPRRCHEDVVAFLYEGVKKHESIEN